MTVTTRQYTDSQNEAVRTTPAMETEPVIRLMQAADRTAIADIIRRTWHYDEFCDSRTAQCLSNVFLSSVEADSDRAMVLTLEKQVLGAIMIQDKRIRHRPWTGRLRQAAAISRLLLTKEGRRAARLFGNVDDTDSILLKRAQKAMVARSGSWHWMNLCGDRGWEKFCSITPARLCVTGGFRATISIPIPAAAGSSIANRECARQPANTGSWKPAAGKHP